MKLKTLILLGGLVTASLYADVSTVTIKITNKTEGTVLVSSAEGCDYNPMIPRGQTVVHVFQIRENWRCPLTAHQNEKYGTLNLDLRNIAFENVHDAFPNGLKWNKIRIWGSERDQNYGAEYEIVYG